ncbi:MAG: hypothetical protein ACLPW4_21545 [Candidatus Sulfotelmatobacter sp.]
MKRIECSVWNNGQDSWGLKILGGVEVRRPYFDRQRSPVLIELDGALCPCNIDKKSFWTQKCGELVSVHLRSWIMKNGLTHGDHVWLEILEPFQAFRVVRARSDMKETA